jgi:hypothetical protein
MLSFPKLHTGIPTIDQQWEKLVRRFQEFIQGHPVTNAEVVAMAIGDVVYIGEGVRQAYLAQGDSAKHADFAGVMGEPTAASARGIMQTSDVQLVHMEDALTPVGGNDVYVSASTAGRGTNVAPVGVGEFVSKFGIIVDASMYVTVTYPYCKVLIHRCCTPNEIIG